MIEILKSLPASRLKDYLELSAAHLTPKKLLNILKVEKNYFLRETKISSFPYLLTVDPTNICQLRCPLCATGQRKNLRPRGKMDFLTLKKIIDEIGEYLLDVHLLWWGEPFLNGDLLKMVEYANRKNIGTFISSNFSLPMFEESLKKIVNSGLDVLSVSLDGITPETYQKYRVGGDFDLVIKNIKALAGIKKKLNSKKPRLEWQFLVNKFNEPQTPLVKSFAKNLGVDSVVFEQPLVLFGQSDHQKIKIREWLPKDKKYRPSDHSLNYNKSDNLSSGRCWWLYRGVAISHDGGVSPCCYNNAPKYDFGNILKNNFVDIWNNEKYFKARSLFSNKRKKSQKPTQSEIICDHCSIL